jgi:glyoxylate reductase
MGRIGAALAVRCVGGWGTKVLYNDPYCNADAERNSGATRRPRRRCSRRAIRQPAREPHRGTHGTFDAAAFKKMKRTAVFVNTAQVRS